ncbi:MAG: glycoside hydrolase family 31 protein [Sulfuricurvum sp.]|nr:glycoside hydrolase family 31 protein [Sulfuricurvum sp.]
MKKYRIYSVIFYLTFLYSVVGFTQVKSSVAKKEIVLLQNEKWWGGAVVDGPKMPYNQDTFVYDQYANCKGNQSQPLFISNKGRFIWSEKPLKIEFSKGKISVVDTESQVVTGKSGESLKDVYTYVSKKFFPPTGKAPDSLFFSNPQYNTWVELHINQNEKDILKYAQAIIDNGFPTGVLMIDDNWQEYYGTWEFSGTRFQNPKEMIDKLHKMGFKVMLWIAPFVSSDTPNFRQLLAKKELMFADKKRTKPAIVQWWNGYSGLLDFSNPDATAWLKNQLKNLVDKYGVDGFKVDGGNPKYYNGLYSLNEIIPNEQSELYAKIGLDFPLSEVKDTWKMAGQPIAQRLRDKFHTWNDLRLLIPDMIALGLIGHPFGCPDMIGGGVSFEDKVLDEELIVRSAQVSALMPMMQFSVAPWRILNKEQLQICKNMAILHAKMGSEILELAIQSAKTGEPILRNMEYVFPGNGYEEVKDQFLMGNNILVAPITEKGLRSREVIFPDGTWQGEDGSIVIGPIKLKIVVPLDRLPWYRKKLQ